MKNILVAYGSKHGQTAKIARALEQELRHLGNSVTLKDVRIKHRVDLNDFDGVLISAPVYAGKYPKGVVSWIRGNSGPLSRKPSAFLSVCLGVLEKGNEATQAQERKIMDSLFANCEWRPTLTRIVPGAMAYTRYNWFLRRFMKKIAAKAGGSTDTSRDHEYTDWDEIRRIAGEFSELLANSLKTTA